MLTAACFVAGALFVLTTWEGAFAAGSGFITLKAAKACSRGRTKHCMNKVCVCGWEIIAVARGTKECISEPTTNRKRK